MKNVITIFFLLIYLFGCTDASQVIRLPLLVKHYIRHHHEDPSMTVLSFLKMHYVGQQLIDSDYQQDMQLPFKTPVDISMTNSPTILPATPRLFYNDPDIVQEKYSLSDDQTPLYSFSHTIFQPPKA